MMKQENEDEVEMVGSSGGSSEVQEQLIPEKTTNQGVAAKKRSNRKSAPTKDGLKRKSRKKRDAANVSVVVKYTALFLLVAQMVGLVLLMRYSRTKQLGDEPLYLASTAVFVMEVMKLVICCAVIAYQSGGKLASELNSHVFQAPKEMAKLCVPSFLYTVQNNLLYLALTNLDAATYQVCYQLLLFAMLDHLL